MCCECWKEFKGWCKAFFLTELLLAILEAILLIVCIGFMIFLIMHMTVCKTWTSDLTYIVEPESNTSQKPWFMGPPERNHSTVDPKLKCSWTPSHKTDPVTRYFEQKETSAVSRSNLESTTNTAPHYAANLLKLKYSPTMNISYNASKLAAQLEGVDTLALDDDSDGEEVWPGLVGGDALLALVKPGGAGRKRGVFGCVLTAVARQWALTAASCIEAIEEVDSLDSFVMMERVVEQRKRSHAVSDVQIHPLYQGSNRSYDVAALSSEDPFRSAVSPLALPSLVDYFLITPGERFSILGFGPFRSVEPTSVERPVRTVNVYSLPPSQCREAGGEEGEVEGAGWAQRHLSRGREEPHASGGCGAAALCAGVRWARGVPCGYCAGTPLVRRGELLGVMTDARACAQDCGPRLYVNLALVKEWIDMLLEPQ